MDKWVFVPRIPLAGHL